MGLERNSLRIVYFPESENEREVVKNVKDLEKETKIFVLKIQYERDMI